MTRVEDDLVRWRVRHRAPLSKPISAAAAIAGVALCVAAGCTSVAVQPELETTEALIRIPARVDYKGAPLFLPRSLEDDGASRLRAHYDYDVRQTANDFPVLLSLFNPLVLVGFPVGTSTVDAAATLNLLRDSESVARYSASCKIEKRRSLYSSRDLTSLRRDALFEIRDAIDSQIARDRARVAPLLAHPEPSPPLE